MDVVLDITRAEIDRHGVRGLVWPLAREEVVAMRDATSLRLVQAIRQSSNSTEARLLSILFGPLLLEAMTLYQAHALIRRYTARGHRAIPPPGRVLDAIAAGCPLPPSPFSKTLLDGLPQPRHRMAQALRHARTAASWNGFSFRVLRPLDPGRDIVAIQQLPLIVQSAQSSNEFVRYVDRGRWLRPLKDGRGAQSIGGADDAHNVDLALDSVRRGFAAGNEELSDSLEQYLRQWLQETMGIVASRMSLLAREHGSIPRRLWTGNGGSVWNRMLRHATRNFGGTVTGFDHVITGHLTMPYATLFEFESCDTFVTFTPDHARALREGLRPDLLIPPKAPDVVSVEPIRRSSFVRTGAPVSSIRTVMYPSSFYNGERMHFGVTIPDIVAVDWEARLFSHLNVWGYEVLFKPHPASVALPPNGFAESFGGRFLSTRFEDVMSQADAFVFINLQSTVIVSMLQCGKPMVYVDPGLFELTPTARELLSRRCAIVRGWFDDSNRLQVDWDQLRGAIQESRGLVDTRFFETYYGF